MAEKPVVGIVGRSWQYFGDTGFSIYYNPDQPLTGLDGVRQLVRVSRDGQVRSVLKAIINIVFSQKPKVSNEDYSYIVDLYLSKGRTLLKNILIAGFGIAEKVFEIEEGKVVLKDLLVLHPTTIWQITKDTIKQQIFGEDGGEFEIPREKVLYLILEDNGTPWGESLILPAYPYWNLKNQYVKIASIGWERAAVGVPEVKYETGTLDPVNNTEDKTLLQNIIKGMRLSSNPGIFHDNSIEVNYLENTGFKQNADGILNWVEYFDNQIARSVLMQFMNLSKGGSYALAKTQEEIFLLSLQYVQDFMFKALENLINEVVAYNEANAEKVTLSYKGLHTEDVKDFINAIAQAVNSGVLYPDEHVENKVRAILDLPEREQKSQKADETQKTVEQIFREQVIQFAQKETPFNRRLKPEERPDELMLVYYDFTQSETELKTLIYEQVLKRLAPLLQNIEKIKDQQARITALSKIKVNLLNDTELKQIIANAIKDLVVKGIERARMEIGNRQYEMPEIASVGSDIQALIRNKVQVTLATIQEAVNSAIARNALVDNIHTLDIEKISRNLAGAASKAVDTNVQFLIGAMYNAGREKIFSEFGKKHPEAIVMRTAVMDENTCENCQALDGFRTSLSSPEFEDKAPPHYCLGGDRCRCIYVLVGDENSGQ